MNLEKKAPTSCSWLKSENGCWRAAQYLKPDLANDANRNSLLRIPQRPAGQVDGLVPGVEELHKVLLALGAAGEDLDPAAYHANRLKFVEGRKEKGDSPYPHKVRRD